MPEDSAVHRSPAPLHPGPAPFDCKLEIGGALAAWVHVAGELDLATAPKLAAVLKQAGQHAGLLILDLREVTFIDSSGVHVIVAAGLERESRLVLMPSPAVERVLAMTGITPHVATFDPFRLEPSVKLHLVE